MDVPRLCGKVGFCALEGSLDRFELCAVVLQNGLCLVEVALIALELVRERAAVIRNIASRGQLLRHAEKLAECLLKLRLLRFDVALTVDQVIIVDIQCHNRILLDFYITPIWC